MFTAHKLQTVLPDLKESIIKKWNAVWQLETMKNLQRLPFHNIHFHITWRKCAVILNMHIMIPIYKCVAAATKTMINLETNVPP